MEENWDKIAPQFREYVAEATIEDVDRNVARAVNKTNSILQQLGLQTPQPGGPAFQAHVPEGISDEYPADFDPSLSMGEYATWRRPTWSPRSRPV